MDPMNPIKPSLPPSTEIQPWEPAPQATYSPGPVVLEQKGVDLLHYWHIILKRKWAAISCVVVITTLAALATFRMTPLYEATGRIAIQRENGDQLGFKNGDFGGSSDDYDYAVTLDTQVRIIDSDALALQVIKKLQLEERGFGRGKQDKNTPAANEQDSAAREAAMIGKVRGNLTVRAVPGTRIIELRYLNPDPKLAAEIVNAIIATYTEQNFKTKFEATMQTSEWLQRQLADLQMKVEASQEKLVRYQKENGILGIDEKQNIITSKLDELNKELTEAEGQRIQKEAAYRMASSGQDSIADPNGPNGTLEKLREKHHELQSQLAHLGTTLGPNYPKVVEVRNELKQVEVAIRQETQRAIEKQKSEYLAAMQREKLLRAAFESQKQEANRLNEKAIDYTILKRDLDSNRQLYEGLLQRLKEAGVSASLRSNNVRIVDSARVPLFASKPNVSRNIGLAFFFSLFSGLALAFLLEHLDNTVRTPEHVEATARLMALAVIPMNRHNLHGTGRRRLGQKEAKGGALQKQDPTPVTLSRPKSEVAEAYRALRTSVLMSGLGAAPKVILVTSPLPQEGKTTTSVNVAVVLAQRGSRVLLIDADMRRPNIHKRLKVSNATGLSSVLTGGATLQSAIQQSTNVQNLWVMPAGSVPPHPAELLGSEFMRQLVQDCSQEYDHIVIDTPPCLSVSDAAVASAYADTVLLVIRAGKTTKQALRRTSDLLLRLNAKVAGVVLNGFDLSSPDNYYYYSYYGYSDARKYYNEETEVAATVPTSAQTASGETISSRS